MEICCSLKSVVGGVCSFDRKDRTRSTQVIPLLSCKREISSHLRSCKFSGPQNEVELILSRAGMFKTPHNIEEITICPNHRSILGVGWSRGSNARCRIPTEVSGHKGRLPRANRGIGKDASEILLKRTGKLIQVGSGMCTNCEKKFNQDFKVKEDTEEDISDVAIDFEKLVVTEKDSEVIFKTPYGTPTVSTIHPQGLEADTPVTLYQPSEVTSMSFTEPEGDTFCETTPRDHLNAFLASRDVSPVRYSLTTAWDAASDRTKRLHIRKAKQMVDACLHEIAPQDHQDLFDSVVSARRDCDTIDSTLLEALTECYNNANHWSTRRQILSIIADKVSYKDLQKWIPDLSRYRYNIARHHRLLHGRGSVVPVHATSRTHVPPEKLDHFLSFITSAHIIQDLPFGEKSLKLSTNVQVKVPNVVRTMIPAQIVRQYESHCNETGFSPMSRSTLYRILKVCSASTRKSLQGLDNFSAEGAKAFEELQEVIENLGDECGKGLEWAKKQNEKLKVAKRYLKTDYKVHISQNSSVPDHCKTYALSYPGDKDYLSKCDHEHKEKCDRCDIFPTVITEVSQVLESLEDGVEKDQMKYQIDQCKHKIDAWKAHILRSINQDKARLDVLQNLGPESALLVLDWAMKFLPRKFRETQSDWFGKRGISWHIAVAMRKSEAGNMEMLTFVHIFKKCTQGSGTVLAIIDDIFQQMKSIAPKVTNFFLRQDNAGCYHSNEVVLSVYLIATKHNMELSMDFSDPQGGKGPCDRKAATLKTKMKIHLNEGHDIETAEDMVAAIESQGGVPGVRVRLCGQQVDEEPFSAKFEGISFLNNMKFSKEGIRVWRAYEIGEGKFKSWKEFDVPKDYQPPTLQEPHELSAHSASVTFVNITARRGSKKICSPEKPDSFEEEEAMDEDNPDTAESLFFCSEEGCVKSFKRHSSLQNHLDCGKHKYALERETLFDRAMMMYASKLEQGSTCDLPQLSEDLQVEVNLDTPVLKMGWALKSSKEYKRLTEKQKAYLLDVYQVGEETGQKADPVSVSRAMKKSRLSSGEPMFTATEYLTAQQIGGFFSRETAKRRKVTTTTVSEAQKDEKEVITEQLIQELQSEVLSTVSLHHPIVYDTYNLCDYASRNKLDRFSILLLQDICSFLQLDTSCIKSKRKLKKPYIDLIMNVVKNCTCN